MVKDRTNVCFAWRVTGVAPISPYRPCLSPAMLLPNLPPPTEGIHHTQELTDLYVNRRSLGTGTLCIAESRVSWAKNGEASGLSLEYPHIAITAVSRDLNAFSHPCLYMMLDVKLDQDADMNNGGAHSDSDEDEDEEAADMTEIRFVPSVLVCVLIESVC